METKIINPLRSGFKNTLKIKVKNVNHRLMQHVGISSWQLIMWLSSVCGLHVPAAPHEQGMVSWGISSQTWIRSPVSTWTPVAVLGGVGWYITWRYITSHRGSMEFRFIQWHQCLHHPGPAYTLWPHEAGRCPAPGGTRGPMHQRKVWQPLWGFYLTAEHRSH